MAATATSERFGAIVNDIDGMGQTAALLGGVGTCRWKQLINGMHLNAQWNCVEYVIIPPGASCGAHTHLRTEEIYYILDGAAEMEANGERIWLSAGDLITAPIGTTHGTVNDTESAMAFLVVEVFPGSGEAPPLIKQRIVPDGKQTTGVLDLATHFTGPWRSFAVIDLRPGDTVKRPRVDDGDETLFVASGSAQVTYGGAVATGQGGLTVGIPPGLDRTVCNSSERHEARILSIIVGID